MASPDPEIDLEELGSCFLRFDRRLQDVARPGSSRTIPTIRRRSAGSKKALPVGVGITSRTAAVRNLTKGRRLRLRCAYPLVTALWSSLPPPSVDCQARSLVPTLPTRMRRAC